MLVYPKQVHFALRILQKSKYERTQVWIMRLRNKSTSLKGYLSLSTYTFQLGMHTVNRANEHSFVESTYEQNNVSAITPYTGFTCSTAAFI